MCTHQRLITNIYTHKEFYVKCGKCPACLQEKAAHRVSRIKNTKNDALEVMMVSLTYARGTAPYIDRQEAYDFAHGKIDVLNVYRDSIFRRVRVTSDYQIAYKRTNIKNVLTQIPYLSESTFENCRDLKHEHNKIGVSYYPDLQRFVARLRLNLKRIYSYEKPFKTYSCSEYGAKSKRPHFHMLIFYSKGDFETLRSAIIKSWPFSDLQMWPRAIERCFRGSSYVASYVNSGSSFPSFLKKYFKPKHSYSKGFGMGFSLFGLSSILSMYDRGTLKYGVQRDKFGIPTVVDVPVPAYVVHRYFPKFKGYSRISPTSLSEVMRGVYNFDYVKTKLILDKNCLYYSPEEFNKFNVMLNNAYQRFKENAPLRYKDIPFVRYADLHQKIWRLHASTVLRLHLENPDIPLNEKYDNLDWIKYKRDNGLPVPHGFEDIDLSVTSPNDFISTRTNTYRFEKSFHENIKHRSVTNAVLSNQFEEW